MNDSVWRNKRRWSIIGFYCSWKSQLHIKWNIFKKKPDFIIITFVKVAWRLKRFSWIRYLITCQIIVFYCEFLNKIQFRITTSSILHYNITDFFRFEVNLMSFNVVDYKSDFSERWEEPFAESNEKLLDNFFVDNSLLFRDVSFHEVHERALIRVKKYLQRRIQELIRRASSQLFL